MTNLYSQNFRIVLAIAIGVLTAWVSLDLLNSIVSLVTNVFISLFKFISLPILFFSILSAFSKIDNFVELKTLSKKTIVLTIFTTTTAALIALALFLLINPTSQTLPDPLQAAISFEKQYVDYLLNMIPSNILLPFIEYNLISIVLIAIGIGFSSLYLPFSQKALFNDFSGMLFGIFMKLTDGIIFIMPLAIWAFTAKLILDYQVNENIDDIIPYLICVIGANVVQAFVVLPLVLFVKGLSPVHVFRKVYPALMMAFFTKSSSITLPTSIKCSTEGLAVSPKISNFTLPLCTTINMNACAAFILITVLFVTQASGVQLTTSGIIGITIFSIIAAIGNASVPMGCYFMATSFLVAMDIPIEMMAFILPFYLFLDMIETAINVWSDICITAVVDKDMKGENTEKVLQA